MDTKLAANREGVAARKSSIGPPTCTSDSDSDTLDESGDDQVAIFSFWHAFGKKAKLLNI